jgi:protein-disulfide isomerase
MSEHDSGSARREAARQRARTALRTERARRRRTTVLGVGALVLGTVAVVTVVAVVVAQAAHPDGPGPRNAASDGVVLRGDHGEVVADRARPVPPGGTPTPTRQHDGVVDITVYADYMCPYCNQFETAQFPQIERWVREGTATLELHPVSVLDRSSLGARYSTRSAAAAACVADHDPDAFLAVNSALFAEQPSESTRGLTDDELVAIAARAGAAGPAVTTCITRQHFAPWVARATERARTGPVPNSSLPGLTSTPTILVDGRQYGADPRTQSLTDPAQLAAFVGRSGR